MKASKLTSVKFYLQAPYMHSWQGTQYSLSQYLKRKKKNTQKQNFSDSMSGASSPFVYPQVSDFDQLMHNHTMG